MDVKKIIVPIYIIMTSFLVFSPTNAFAKNPEGSLLGHMSDKFKTGSSGIEGGCINLPSGGSQICAFLKSFNIDNEFGVIGLYFTGRDSWDTSMPIKVGLPRNGQLYIQENRLCKIKSGEITVHYKFSKMRYVKERGYSVRPRFEGEIYVEIFGNVPTPPSAPNQTNIPRTNDQRDHLQQKSSSDTSSTNTQQVGKSSVKELRYAKALYDSGKTSKAFNIIENLKNSSDETIQHDAMYYSILWGFELDEEDAIIKFKAYYPNSNKIKALESKFYEKKKEQEQLLADKKAWDEAKEQDTKTAYQTYLTNFSIGKYADNCRNELSRIVGQEIFEKFIKGRNLKAFGNIPSFMRDVITFKNDSDDGWHNVFIGINEETNEKYTYEPRNVPFQTRKIVDGKHECNAARWYIKEDENIIEGEVSPECILHNILKHFGEYDKIKVRYEYYPY